MHLIGESVSSFHCSLVRTPLGVWVVDLFDKNGVRVNSISPGNIYTPLWQEAIDGAPDPAECRAEGEAAQWLGRMGTVED